jgi:hypothetical protein
MRPNQLPTYRDPLPSEERTNTGVHRKEIWLVQVTSDDLRPMTLEQMHDAYQKGLIDDRTLVLPDGIFQWTELGSVRDEVVACSS